MIDFLVRDINSENRDESYKVLVIGISDSNLECPGMLGEEKFLSQQQQLHHDYLSSASSAASFYFRSRSKKNNASVGGEGGAGVSGVGGSDNLTAGGAMSGKHCGTQVNGSGKAARKVIYF